MSLVLALVFAVIVAGCSTGDKTVAIVNGEKIKKSQLDRRVNKLKQQYQQQGAKFDNEQGKQMLKALEQTELDKLIDEYILFQEAEKQNVLPSDKEVEQKVQETKKKFKSDAEFESVLKGYNMDVEGFKNWMKMGMAQEALYAKVTKDVTIKPADIKKYYEENPSLFEVKESVRARHILIKYDTPQTQPQDKVNRTEEQARKIAKEILAQVKAGADFAELAKKKSEDPGSKDNGGEYTFGRGQMVKEFEDAAFALKPGQVTKDLVKTVYGFHIIKLEEKIPAKKKSFDEVKKELEQTLPAERKKQVFMDFFNKIKKEAKIEYKIERINLGPAPGTGSGAGGQGQKPPGHP